MPITIDLPQDLEAFLQEEADAAGITLHEHIIRILFERLKQIRTQS